MSCRFFTASVFIFIFSLNVTAQRAVRKGMKQDGKEMGGKQTVKAQDTHAKYTLAQLSGKWQEIKRTGGNADGSFIDTLLIIIKNGRGEVRTAGTMTMSMKGPVAIDAPAELSIAGDVYSVQSLDEKSMVLADGNFIRTMKKTDRFYSETVGKDSINEAVYTAPVNTDIKMLSGKWDIYRRQAAPGFINDNTTLIKSISFLQQADETHASGMIVTYNTGTNISEELACTYSFAGGQMTVNTAKSAMTFTVYKADRNEFVFGKEGEVVNYAKQ